MWDDLPDEELMQRVASNDPAAFDALFMRHRTGVFNYTLRMVADRARAEDLTQECFLRVWQARHRYQPAAAFRTWLFTIARRLALNELKGRRPAMVAAGDAEGEHLAEPVSPEVAARLVQSDPQQLCLARE